MWIKEEQRIAWKQFLEEQEKMIWMSGNLTRQQILARSLKRDSKGRFVARQWWGINTLLI